MLGCCWKPDISTEDEITGYEGGLSPGSAALSKELSPGKQPSRPSKQVPPACKSFYEKLTEMLNEKPYLRQDNHILSYYVQSCEEAIYQGDKHAAEDGLDQLEMELDVEEKTITAAFVKFDTKRDGNLNAKELQFMMTYLGFPNSDKDVKMLLDIVDTNGDQDVSLDEFLDYVGRMGGSSKLFELRRKTTDADEGEASVDPATMRKKLQEAGFQADAQAYWKLVVPASEMSSAAQMVPCQQQAVRHIRALAQENHERALPLVQKRVAQLGFADNDLWMALAWIRELAPVIVHFDLDKIGQYLEGDTHYRNQFETNKSGGLLNTSAREKWERGLFGTCYDKAKAFDRPKYGVQNIWNDWRGVMGAKQYGDSYMVLKDVRLRCTFSPEDSANLPARRLSVLDFYGHVLNEYSDLELKETLRVASGVGNVGDSEKVIEKWGKYKEAQIHGEVSLSKHVERIVANQRHRGQAKQLERICKKHGCILTWMDDMKAELSSKGQHSIGEKEWRERLQQIQKEAETMVTEEEVPEGYCKKGCGRPVAPGTTKNGNPFKTCCKGCVMGFGHDATCGKVDPKKLKPGCCKMGCGKPVKPGFDTCCRRCAKGLGAHDANCGLSVDSNAPGMCQMGCGRPVAPGTMKNGKPFKTCCRNCAMGKKCTCAP